MPTYSKDIKDLKTLGQAGKLIVENISKFLGPTGDFPDGKISKDDEGGLKIAVVNDRHSVFIEFGKEIRWIGLTPAQAIELGNAIIHHAQRCSDA